MASAATNHAQYALDGGSGSEESQYLLDIITITKDDYDGVAATLASCRNLRRMLGVIQTVVDSSEEAVAERVQALCAGEPTIAYHWVEPRGIAQALNEGLRLAAGKWLWYLHGGDQVAPDLALEPFLGLLAASRADVIVFDMLSGGRISRHPGLAKLWPPARNWVPHPATLVRREVLASIGGFDLRHATAMDHDLWFRLFKGDNLVDLVSFPVAVFAPGGASSRPGANADCRRVMRHYAPLAFWSWLQAGANLVSAYAWWFCGTGKDVAREAMRIARMRMQRSAVHIGYGDRGEPQ